jgi:hypothetical protein
VGNDESHSETWARRNFSPNAFELSQLDKLEIGEKNPKGTAPRGPFSFAAYKEPGHASAPINFPENSTESMNYNANFLKAQ